MAISDKIKEHRKKANMTQRELAEALGVSVQAISKWETGSGIPDVSALIPLARELHITTDELLDFHDRRQELETLWQKTLTAHGDGSKEVYDCVCEALREFPEDEAFLHRRAAAARYIYENTEKGDPGRNAWFSRHHAQLLSVMESYPEWDWPVAEMVHLLVAADRKRDAVTVANRAVGDKQYALLKQCLEGEELRQLRQVRIEKMFRDLLSELHCEDRAFLDTEEKLIQTVIPDGNYLYYYDLLMMIEIKRAEISAAEREYDHALGHLENAFVHARKEDACPGGKFTCPLFSTLSYRNSIEKDPPAATEKFRDILTGSKAFTPLYHRNKYKQLLRQADACIQYGKKGYYPVKATDETAFPLSEFMDLMEMAKADMAASEQLVMSEALAVETADGSIYRTLMTDPRPDAVDTVSEMIQIMKKQGTVEIKRLVCLRQSGVFVMPKLAVLRLFCALHRNNAEAAMLLSGENGLLKRKIRDTFPSYLQKFLYCKPDAADLFEVEEYDGKSCEDLLSIGRQILSDQRKDGTPARRADILLLRTAKGNIYHRYISDLSADTGLIDELVKNEDTCVTEMVCMTENGGLDIGNFRFRDRLFDLDERNGSTKLLLQGYDSRHFRSLFSCFSPQKLENIAKQNERNIRIKRMEQTHIEDYLAFFDRVSSGSMVCYCAHYHRTEEEDDAARRSGFQGPQAMRTYHREESRRFILEGRIQGYLVYRDGKVIGWCQAKDKTGYHYLRDEVHPSDNPKGEVLSISCLVMEEEYQNQGIASVLVDYIAGEAGNRGYKRLEAYPNRQCLSVNAFASMIRFYEKQGFVTSMHREDWRLMQKELQ